jgi:hypothetical protein
MMVPLMSSNNNNMTTTNSTISTTTGTKPPSSCSTQDDSNNNVVRRLKPPPHLFNHDNPARRRRRRRRPPKLPKKSPLHKTTKRCGTTINLTHCMQVLAQILVWASVVSLSLGVVWYSGWVGAGRCAIVAYQFLPMIICGKLCNQALLLIQLHMQSDLGRRLLSQL